MAKEEKKTEIRAYIDYDGTDEISNESWTTTNLESFFAKTLIKDRKLSAHPWSIKTKSLAKRVMNEFDINDLQTMLKYWIQKSHLHSAASFEIFYQNRYTVYEKIKPKDYNEWEN